MDKKKILIADDDQMTLNLYKIQFQKDDNLEVHIVNSGDKAFSLLTEIHFDLVLLDIRMPGLSSPEVYKKMQASSKLKNIPVIFITNVESDDPIIEKGLSKNIAGYIVKSEISLKDLKQKVMAVLFPQN